MAQAGNRAGKTQCYLQWWDSGAECLAVTAAKCKVCDRVLLFYAHIREYEFEVCAHIREYEFEVFAHIRS